MNTKILALIESYMLESKERKEQAKVCLNPLNFETFKNGVGTNKYINKYPPFKAEDVVTDLLWKQILFNIEKYNLPVIHEKYDDYNWYCIFGNYHDDVLKKISLDSFTRVDDSDLITEYGTRGIGKNYYHIYIYKRYIFGRCSLDRQRSRWILIADQGIFDNMNMSITR